MPERPLLGAAAAENLEALVQGLSEEQEEQREQDRIYWQPLKAELEKLRHQKFRD